MKLTLTRTNFSPEGIFSTLSDDQGKVLFHTLEHAYLQPDGTYKPKIYDSTFLCKRGYYPKHKETFEVTGVKGHSFLLFHTGNYNQDSEGCILLGMERSGNMVVKSKIAFAGFMVLLEGINEFELEVK